MAKGNIVLISFPFTDLTGKKMRPAVILTEDKFDVTVCFITSQVGWQEPTDLLLSPNNVNGLKKQSLIRISKIATLEKSLVKGILGKLSESEILELNKKLVQLLKLN
ncbi:MAG TPA: type II toxin-antitoxin system PemK/MazF family toxin [Pelobium sp.]|nr:type II toxin-antitoxin system PemK/MazF family toxin [Pelobium sp.]